METSGGQVRAKQEVTAKMVSLSFEFGETVVKASQKISPGSHKDAGSHTV